MISGQLPEHCHGITGLSGRDKYIVVPVNMNIDYLSEVDAGDVIYMQGAIVSANGKKLVCKWKLYDQATEKQAMEATVLYLCMDLDSRRSRDIPQHLLESVQKVLAKEEG